MRVLAVDTTTPRGSLAIVDESGTLAEARVHADGGHSRWLLPAVDVLVEGLGLRPADLDLFAASTGPGSFTGLRVGLSATQGLALAAGRSCVGVPTLDLLASAAPPTAGGPLVAVIEAHRDELYWAAFDAWGERLLGPGVAPPEALAAALGALAHRDDAPALAFVGEITREHRDRLAEASREAVFLSCDPHLAPTLGRQALLRAAAGRAVTPAELLPVYVRPAAVRPPRA